MPLSFRCPYCQLVVQAGEELRRTSVRCGSCGEVITVPDVPEALPITPPTVVVQPPSVVHGCLIFLGVISAVILAAVLLTCGGCLSIFVTAGRKSQDHQPTSKASVTLITGSDQADAGPTPVLWVTAGQLARDYRANEAGADREYKGKYLTVEGVVREVGKDSGQTFLLLGEEGDDVSFRVRCLFKNSNDLMLATLRGDICKVVGQCNGWKGNVVMVDCRLAK